MSIEELRKEIDLIDDKISQLFIERMEKCKQIGLIKSKNKLSVNAPLREKEIINRVTQNADNEVKSYIKQLYENIFLLSKTYQNSYNVTQSNSVNKIRACLENKKENMPTSASVACQGVAGAYSSIAAEKLFSISNITYFKNFEGVFNAVDKGLCEFGILPIENSTAGSVLQVYDLMEKYNFYIVESVRLQVSHVLAVKPGVERKDIKEICSHEQALQQCAEYIKKFNYKTTTMQNTAIAGSYVAESDRNDIAAICSEECANIYGLKIIEKAIQDNPNNFTRFICISKNMKILNGADKISVMTSLQNKPGSLNKMLSRFAAEGLNLSKIESRPIPNCQFEFMFYCDFSGDIENQGVLNLMSELDNNSDKFAFLGCYKEIV